MKQTVKLTERELKRMISESVKKALNENLGSEGVFLANYGLGKDKGSFPPKTGFISKDALEKRKDMWRITPKDEENMQNYGGDVALVGNKPFELIKAFETIEYYLGHIIDNRNFRISRKYRDKIYKNLKELKELFDPTNSPIMTAAANQKLNPWGSPDYNEKNLHPYNLD